MINIIDDTLPIVVGFPFEKNKIFDIADITLKNPAGIPIPFSAKVNSRWEGDKEDVSKSIKWIALDIPAFKGIGKYTVEIAKSQLEKPRLDLNIAGTGFEIDNDLIKVSLEKGQKPLNYFIKDSDQLENFRISITLPNKTMAVSLGNEGRVAALKGTNKLRVKLPKIFNVGQKITFSKVYKFSSVVQSDPPAIVIEDNYGYAGNFVANNGRKFVFDRENRNFTLEKYQYIWDSAVKYFARVQDDNFPLDMPSGVLVEDLDMVNESAKTIIDIQNDVLILDSNFEHDILENCDIIPENAEELAGIFTATVHELVHDSGLRKIIKQTGYFDINGSNPYPDLQAYLYWTFYADTSYIKCQFRLRNSTDDINHLVTNVSTSQLKIEVKTIDRVNNFNDGVFNNLEACTRVRDGRTYVRVGTSNSFALGIPQFPQNFPQRLSSAGNIISYEILPKLDNFIHVFHADRAKTWTFFLGVGAAKAAANFDKPAFTLDSEYVCNTDAVRHGLVPRKEWKAEDFQGNTRIAEAANRWEKLLSVAYDVTEAEDVLPPQIPMSIEEYRNSPLLFPESNNNFGQYYGWQYFGDLHEGSDGYTKCRYDWIFQLLRQFVRTEHPQAFKYAIESASYMADYGTIQSALSNGGNTEYNKQFMNWYEKGTEPWDAQYPAYPTHNWCEGLLLAWALTDDPIIYEVLIGKRDRERSWNFNGVGVGAGSIDGSMAFNSARGVSWSALILVAFYRYFGDKYDLDRAKQYLDNLRLSEESQGAEGVYCTPAENYELPPKVVIQSNNFTEESKVFWNEEHIQTISYTNDTIVCYLHPFKLQEYLNTGQVKVTMFNEGKLQDVNIFVIENKNASGLQTFIWAGYTAIALYEYLKELDFQGLEDKELKEFAVRMAAFVARGKASNILPGKESSIRGGKLNVEKNDYTPLGAIFYWFKGIDNTWETGSNAIANLFTLTMGMAARYGKRADFRALTDKLFTDVIFYRDWPDGGRDYDQRVPINLRNQMFFQSGLKLWAQTAFALGEFLPDWQAINKLNSPRIEGISFSDGILTLKGYFPEECFVSISGAKILPRTKTSSVITLKVPNEVIVKGEQPIAVFNEHDFGQSLAIYFDIPVTEEVPKLPLPEIISVSPSILKAKVSYDIMVNVKNLAEPAEVFFKNVKQDYIYQNGIINFTITDNVLENAGYAGLKIVNKDGQFTEVSIMVTMPDSVVKKKDNWFKKLIKRIFGWL